MPLDKLNDLATLGEQRTKINSTIDEINSITDGTSSGGIPVTATGTTTPRTLGDRFADTVNVKDFGVVGDGVADDTLKIQEIESSTYEYVDMLGLNILTTLREETITKKYFNGNLIVRNFKNFDETYKQKFYQKDFSIDKLGDKTSIFGVGKSFLWLGTSIPQFGVGVDSYPELTAKKLDGEVLNNAWAGSHATFTKTDDAFDIATVKALSMTEQDRLNGVAEYGTSSAYDDSFDVVTKASKMTCEHRIKLPMSTKQYDIVVLDHNYNDRIRALGDASPVDLSITGVTMGSTTTINLSDVSGIALGDSIVARISGITEMEYLAATVINVSGSAVIVDLDSSGYAGSFSSGVLNKVDKSTIFGSYEFLIHFIYNSALTYGHPLPVIVTSSSPNDRPNNAASNSSFGNSLKIKQVSDKWGLAFFDIRTELNVKSKEHLTYFPDEVHPTTSEAREVISNYWVKWFAGGETPALNKNDFLPSGVGDDIQSREPLYSIIDGGYKTRSEVLGNSDLVFSDDFSSGTISWSEQGTGTITTGASPYGATNSVRFQTASGTPKAYLEKTTGVDLGNNPVVSFDFYLENANGLTSTGVRTVDIIQLRAPEARYVLQLKVTNTDAELMLGSFETPNANYSTLSTGNPLVSQTKYSVKIYGQKSTSKTKGGLILEIDGVRSLVVSLDDESQKPITKVALGVVGSNIDGNLDLWISNFQSYSRELLDYTKRYTGGMSLADGKNATVVNGIIIDVV